jgi:hypothetical protein
MTSRGLGSHGRMKSDDALFGTSSPVPVTRLSAIGTWPSIRRWTCSGSPDGLACGAMFGISRTDGLRSMPRGRRSSWTSFGRISGRVPRRPSWRGSKRRRFRPRVDGTALRSCIERRSQGPGIGSPGARPPGSILGARYSVFGVDPVPGPGSQVPGTRDLEPGTRRLSSKNPHTGSASCILYPASIF